VIVLATVAPSWLAVDLAPVVGVATGAEEVGACLAVRVPSEAFIGDIQNGSSTKAATFQQGFFIAKRCQDFEIKPSVDANVLILKQRMSKSAKNLFL
jgi:hypothetical protein